MVDKNLIELKLYEVFRALAILCKNNKHMNEYGLYTGCGGIVLFMYYYYHLTKNKEALDIAYNMLNKVFATINKQKTIMTNYCEGLSGVYALIYHLLNNNFIESDRIEYDSRLDSLFINQMEQCIQRRDYDFFYGATGYLYLYYNKYMMSKSKYDLDIMVFIVDIIYKCTNENVMHFAFFESIEGNVSLGIPHGISGYLLLFVKLYKSNIARLKVSAIMENLMMYYDPFLKQDNSLNYFPCSYSIKESIENINLKSRLGWCYGDISCAIAILKYAEITNNEELTAKALDILDSTTRRKDLDSNFIWDAGICHGSSGLAFIYALLARRYPYFKNFYYYSEYWYSQTLKFANYNNSYAGFSTVKHVLNRVTYYEKDASLLTGISGIGLSLILKLSNINNWCDFFLID